MDKSGPIVIIEDDPDDQYILKDIFSQLDLKNAIVFYDSGQEALHFLKKEDVKPFIILSDINMPGMNGFDLRTQICLNEELRNKCVPYLFFTTSSSKSVISQAYALSIHGFFVKPDSGSKLKKMLFCIVDYWQNCVCSD